MLEKDAGGPRLDTNPMRGQSARKWLRTTEAAGDLRGMRLLKRLFGGDGSSVSGWLFASSLRHEELSCGLLIPQCNRR